MTVSTRHERATLARVGSDFPHGTQPQNEVVLHAHDV